MIEFKVPHPQIELKPLLEFAQSWNEGKWLSCGRKKKFKTQEKAERCAKAFKQRAYRCPHCQSYHTTSK